MELWCFITLGFHCMHVPEGNHEQKMIMFSDGEYLRMNVRLEYLPYEYDTYTLKLMTSANNTYLPFTTSYLNKENTIVIDHYLESRYQDTVLRIVLGSTLGKGDLTRDFARLIHFRSHDMSNDCTKIRCTIYLPWLKSYPHAEDESTYRYTAASIKKQPFVVSFKKEDNLTVALGFKNTLTRIENVYMVFAYSRENNSQVFITRFNSNLVLNETFDKSYMKIQLCTDKPCSVSDTFPVIYLQYDDSRTDQNCLATRCNIILDFGDEESHENSYNESVAVSVVNDEINAGPYRTPPWLIVVATLAAMLVLVLAVVMVLRRRSNKRDQSEDEGIYATAQVTYAVLDLPPDRNLLKNLKKEESTPYAVIAGALTPVIANNK